MASSVSIVPMEKAPIDSLSAKPPKAFGKAKLVYLEPKLMVSSPKLPQAWPVRPADDKNEKFALVCRVPTTEEKFKGASTAFDMRIRRLAFQERKAWFGKGADDIETENDLKQMQTLSIKKGNEKPDGTRWDDEIKFSVKGWADYVEEIVYKGEGDKRMPVDVVWRSRMVDPQGSGGPGDEATKFYICEGIDMTTGKEKMAPWTPCLDPSGQPMKDSAGNVMWEFVSPKHCKPGCQIRVVYQPSMVWLASKFGVTLQAKQVFITPPPPKAKAELDGITIVDTVDPIMAARAAKHAMATDELRDLDSLPAEAEDTAGDVDAFIEAVTKGGAVGGSDGSTSAEAEAGKKRKTNSAEAAVDGAAATASPAAPSKASKSGKKTKTVTVDEDF